MSSNTEGNFKRLCYRQCVIAVCLGIAMQYILLSVFLLVVYFSLLHPILWILNVIGYLFSFWTWIRIIPLIGCIILYGLFSSKAHLTPKKYYSTRMRWFYDNALYKIASFFSITLIGFFTVLLYLRFLDERFKTLLTTCDENSENQCLNAKYIFLVFNGIFTGVYFFFMEKFKSDAIIVFPIIQESRYVKIRSQLYTYLYKSLIQTFTPTLIYAVLFWLIGGLINRKIAFILSCDIDTSLNSIFSIASNIWLIMNCWIFSSLIVCSLYLLDRLFMILLTEQREFPIEKDFIHNEQEESPTLDEALALFDLPIAQQLASLDLFNIANSSNGFRRRIIFSLSLPGGHPYNWRRLSGQCLSIIDSFTSELSTSIKNISIIRNINTNIPSYPIKPTTPFNTEKLILRQYNETFGVRNMISTNATISSRPNTAASNSINEQIQTVSLSERIAATLNEARKNAIRSIPGLFYLFGENESAQTTFLLSKCQDIIWITQALSGLCACSLTEDKYGVVQEELQAIIKSLFRLKAELDKISNINLNGKKLDRNCIALKNAVKRSLYRIFTVFGDYIKDIFDDSADIRLAQNYVNYMEA